MTSLTPLLSPLTHTISLPLFHSRTLHSLLTYHSLPYITFCLFQSPVLHSLPPHVSTTHSYGLILVTYSSHSPAHLNLLITKISLTAFSYIYQLLTNSLFYCCTYAITAEFLLLTSCLSTLSCFAFFSLKHQLSYCPIVIRLNPSMD